MILILTNEHIEKSNHNFNAYLYLNKANPKYNDWEVITIFYSTLHLIDAYLLKRDIEVRNHKERNMFVKRLIKPIKDEYSQLYALSIRARYIAKEISDDERSYALILYNKIRSYLVKSLISTR